MGTHFSRDASSFTLMERGIGSMGLKVIIVGCLALTLVTPSLSWAADTKASPNGSSHRLIDHQKIQDLKVRIAELRDKLRNGSSTSTSSLDGLQARVAQLETSVAAILNADNTLLTTLQTAQAQITTLQTRITTLESKPSGSGGGVPNLEKYVSINPDPINGVNGPHIIFNGVNVHIQSGSGATVDTTTGLGNLIIGYNETDPSVGLPRTGSHNLVGGQMNSFSSSGGLVFGMRNAIRGQYAAVLSGERNTASGANSSILGGGQNTASGAYSTVYGGQLNLSAAPYSFTPDPNQGCLGC